MRLKELRKINNKTQDEIATLLNMSQVSYGRYELETSEPTIDTLCKLANYYDVSLDYLIGRDYRNQFSYLTEDEKLLLTDYRQLTQKNKFTILGELKGLLIAQS